MLKSNRKRRRHFPRSEEEVEACFSRFGTRARSVSAYRHTFIDYPVVVFLISCSWRCHWRDADRHYSPACQCCLCPVNFDHSNYALYNFFEHSLNTRWKSSKVPLRQGTPLSLRIAQLTGTIQLLSSALHPTSAQHCSPRGKGEKKGCPTPPANTRKHSSMARWIARDDPMQITNHTATLHGVCVLAWHEAGHRT